MNKVLFPSVALFALAFALFQCASNSDDPLADVRPTLPDQPYDYANMVGLDGRVSVGGTFSQPSFGGGGSVATGITEVGFNPKNPAVTNAGAQLGRVLFYDKRLSINRTVACASCHVQETAFADGGKIGSEGMSGQITPRNSPAICNTGYKNNLFWDSRVQSLPDLIGKPVANHIEMGMESLDQVAKRLGQTDFYPDLFEKAFGSRNISGDKIANAMSQFLGAMISNKSKYDEGVKTNFENFTALEKQGKDIFFNKDNHCNTCHAAPYFGAPDAPFVGYYGDDKRGAANIGLELAYKDSGYRNGEFCIPSLRNIALSAPYMHDGRFKTLDEVVEHYSKNIQTHPNLDANLRSNFGSGDAIRLNFTQDQKAALIAFLNTLTDESITRDVRFSDPFKQ